MEFLSEDPTYLAGGLGLLAGAFLIALRLTQQGKFLVWAGVAFALALLVLGIERVWVTDNERIEQTVYDLGRAVAASDVPGALGLMTPDVQFVARGDPQTSETTRGMIELYVSNARFDFLRINQLRANAGGQSRRGTAEFRVVASGSFEGPYNTLNFGTTNSAWSLGLRETSPGVWKVNRITPVSVPGGGLPSLNFLPRSGRRDMNLPPSAPPSRSFRPLGAPSHGRPARQGSR